MTKQESIKFIQNEVVKIYIEFIRNKDMKATNGSFRVLAETVHRMNDATLTNFCENLIVTYTPIINSFKEWE